MTVQENSCGNEGPDWCRRGKVRWKGWKVGVLGCIEYALVWVGEAEVAEDDGPLLVAGLVKEATAEFEVLCMGT